LAVAGRLCNSLDICNRSVSLYDNLTKRFVRSPTNVMQWVFVKMFATKGYNISGRHIVCIV